MSAWLPLALAALPQTAPADAGAATGPFATTEFRVPKDVQLALRDMTGDGAVDVVWADRDGIEVWVQTADGGLDRSRARRLAWPEGRVAWDLADLDGDGADEVVLLVEGRAVVAHAVTDDALGEAREVLTGTSLLPHGVSHMTFTRDVDGDGRVDLVLPGAGSHAIHLQTDTGFAAPIEVRFEAQIEQHVGDPRGLDASFGQTVTVPWFELKDVDGDGRQDLVSRTSRRVAFHLARPELSSTPTWELDLVALEDELPERDGIDLDDLLSNVTQRVDFRIADLDGKGDHDLILMLGSVYKIYLGGAATGPRETPDQVLRASGNLILTLVRQVHGDELPELQLVRGERIGIGRVVRYLILPGQLTFDLFTYGNEGGTFTRRPTRRNQIVFEIPRLLALIDDDGLVAAVEGQFDIPALRVPSGTDARDGVMDLRDQQLVYFPDCAPPKSREEEVMEGEITTEVYFEGMLLHDLDAGGDGAVKTIDLGDLSTYDFAPGVTLRGASRTAEPAFAIDLDPKHRHQFAARQLNADGKGDVLLVTETGHEYVVTWMVQR
jgi:hypothetical protein